MYECSYQRQREGSDWGEGIKPFYIDVAIINHHACTFMMYVSPKFQLNLLPLPIATVPEFVHWPLIFLWNIYTACKGTKTISSDEGADHSIPSATTIHDPEPLAETDWQLEEEDWQIIAAATP